ncbi:hypothetical protein TNCV_3821531 [Trichonephila clavipes]|nr:hypothetical protein TNCV_3821531 [Trichonephila clavipes]
MAPRLLREGCGFFIRPGSPMMERLELCIFCFENEYLSQQGQNDRHSKEAITGLYRYQRSSGAKKTHGDLNGFPRQRSDVQRKRMEINKVNTVNEDGRID